MVSTEGEVRAAQRGEATGFTAIFQDHHVGMQAVATQILDPGAGRRITVLAHASVFVQQGQNAFVMIDEVDRRRRARREAQWLSTNGHPRRLELWPTRRVLQAAGREHGWITGGATWQQVYDQMTAYNDGLNPRSQW